MLGSFQGSSGAFPVWGFQRGVSGPALRSACLWGDGKRLLMGRVLFPEMPRIWALGFEGCPGVHPAGKQWGGLFRINGQSV